VNDPFQTLNDLNGPFQTSAAGLPVDRRAGDTNCKIIGGSTRNALNAPFMAPRLPWEATLGNRFPNGGGVAPSFG
jgi:hypothetical protein